MTTKWELVDYAKPRTPRSPVMDWLAAHPDLHAQALNGVSKYGYSESWRWLRDKHGFPHSLSQFYTILKGELSKRQQTIDALEELKQHILKEDNGQSTTS